MLAAARAPMQKSVIEKRFDYDTSHALVGLLGRAPIIRKNDSPFYIDFS